MAQFPSDCQGKLCPSASILGSGRADSEKEQNFSLESQHQSILSVLEVEGGGEQQGEFESAPFGSGN